MAIDTKPDKKNSHAIVIVFEVTSSSVERNFANEYYYAGNYSIYNFQFVCWIVCAKLLSATMSVRRGVAYDGVENMLNMNINYS